MGVSKMVNLTKTYALAAPNASTRVVRQPVRTATFSSGLQSVGSGPAYFHLLPKGENLISRIQRLRDEPSAMRFDTAEDLMNEIDKTG
jgi:hypothetical protein